MSKTSPIRPTDKEACLLGRRLIAEARFGALAVSHPATGLPYVARVSVGSGANGEVVSLISDLSLHTKALRSDPRCSLLIGEPEDKGDPLTHPRMTLQAKAIFVERGHPDYIGQREAYPASHPKSKLYIDFADFNFVTFQVIEAHLNGGFGKAFVLSPTDLGYLPGGPA